VDSINVTISGLPFYRTITKIELHGITNTRNRIVGLVIVEPINYCAFADRIDKPGNQEKLDRYFIKTDVGNRDHFCSINWPYSLFDNWKKAKQGNYSVGFELANR